MRDETRTEAEARGVTLTTAQRSVLSSHRASPTTGHQNTPLLIRFDPGIDPERLQLAFVQVVASTDVLRLQIRDTDVATITPLIPGETSHVAASEPEFQDWCQQRAQLPIDLAVSCWESRLCQHPGGGLSWYLNLHHVISDGTSASLLLDRVEAEYRGSHTAVDQYYDVFNDQTDPAAEAFWRARANAQRVDRLYQPLDRQNARTQAAQIPWDADLARAWEAGFEGPYKLVLPGIARSAFLTATTAQYLHRLSGVEDLSIGLVVNHRSRSQSRNLIGPAIGLYPMDVSIRQDDTHRRLFDRTAKTMLATLRHAQPGIVPKQDFDAVVNALSDHVSRRSFADVACRVSWLNAQSVDQNHALRVLSTPYDDVDPAVAARPDGAPALTLEYNAAGLGPVTASAAAGHLRAIVLAALETPDARLDVTQLGGARETRRALGHGEGPTAPEPQPLTPWLRATLEGNRQAVLLEGDREVTGDALWRWAAAIAARLADETTSADVMRVGICLPPSIEAVAAIYGCVLAGVSFVPLDPAQPVERLKSLKQRAAVSLTFETADDIQALRPGRDMATQALPDVQGSGEAYLLFTSGSTGEPKGVAISRDGLAAYLDHATTRYFDGVDTPVAPLLGALTFDATLTTLFAVPLSGGQMFCHPEPAALALTAVATQTRINWMKATPSQLDILLAQEPHLPALRRIITSGEALGSRLARRLTGQFPDVQVINEYGPTETVVGCMEHVATGDDLDNVRDIPIGHPIAGVTLRICDPMGHPVPPGAAGELWISVAGMMDGYLGGDVTSFSYADGTRFYRSGDLVQLDTDGTHLFLGRIDAQMKIDGMRIDPAEIEAAALSHPAIEQAVARVWTPRARGVRHRCTACGLPDNVPGISYDAVGLCTTCTAYDQVRSGAAQWFKTPEVLGQRLQTAQTSGGHGCVHLLSGGKDSTYALYRLVEMGTNPIALTLDNGYISDAAKANIDRVVAHLGVRHEYVRPKGMNAIFRESLQRHSNVCNGCYKALYVMATARADALGVSAIITGLSRGQLFETRLIPEQFQADRFDPVGIDTAVLAARRAYHRTKDACASLPEAGVFSDGKVFERVEYIDFYRYVDVPLSEVLRFLEHETPWQRPDDTGRSTNCLINDTGIHTHLAEQGYHNYAIPYAWDVRLGHRTRDEAIEELDDKIDQTSVREILNELGYEVSPRRVLSLWYTTKGPKVALPDLQAHLAARLPRHALPSGFAQLPEIPLTPSGKIDGFALPPPARALQPRTDFAVSYADPLETQIIALWEERLNVAPIGRADDFFMLGGDSLSALSMVVALGQRLGLRLADGLVFVARTPMALAKAIALQRDKDHGADGLGVAKALDESPAIWTAQNPPPLTTAEAALLFEHKQNTKANRLNVGRIYWAEAQLDPERFQRALMDVAARTVSLSWTYGSPRRPIAPAELVDMRSGAGGLSDTAIRAQCVQVLSEPFDLNRGYLLRALLLPAGANRTMVLLATHHVASDHDGFAALWQQVLERYSGVSDTNDAVLDAPSFVANLRAQDDAPARAYWRDKAFDDGGQILPMPVPALVDRDGLIELDVPVTPLALRQNQSQPLAVRACLAAGVAMRRVVSGGPVTLGLLTTPRNRPGGADLVAHLLNPLPFQIGIDGDRSISDSLADVSRDVSQALAQPYLHFAEITEERGRADLATPTPHAFVSITEDLPLSSGGIQALPETVHVPWSVAPATFFVTTRSDDVTVMLEYDRSIYADTVAEQLLAQFRDLLLACQAPDARPLEQIAPITLSLANGDALPSDALLPELVAAHLNCADTGAPVVICGDVAMSRSDLRARVNTMSAALRAQGIGPGDLVGIALPRGGNLIAAIVAVHGLRAAYVALDHADGLGRNAHVLSAAKPSILLHSYNAPPPEQRSLHVTDDGVDGTPWAGPDALAIPETQDSDVAYVVFTSGTSGTPKGVPIDQRQLARSTHARGPAYPGAPSKFLLVSSFAYDSSIAGLFWTMATGGSLVLPTEQEAHAPDLLGALMARAEASHVLLVPTLYAALLSERQRQALKPWPGHVILAGEDFAPSLAQRHFEQTPDGCRLTNEYGPSEATVWALFHHLQPGESHVLAGRPVPGTWAGILGPNGKPCPEGTIGELVLGGPLVAHGYLTPDGAHQPFGTGAAFGRPDERSYHTGDLAVMQGGILRYIGRKDAQLNLGGLRIEAAEIEHPLLDAAGVRDIAVVALDERSLPELMGTASNEILRAAFEQSAMAADPEAQLKELLRIALPGRVDIVAHVACDDPLPEGALRDLANARLAPMLRPTRYVRHAQLAQHASGKVDRDTLAATAAATAVQPTPEALVVANTQGAVETAVTVDSLQTPINLERLTALFAETLRTKGLSPDSDFFEFGGHSLLALQLILRIEQEFDVTLSTTALYDAPTPVSLLAQMYPDAAPPVANPDSAPTERTKTAPKDRSLVFPLQSGGTRPPIIALHSLGENASVMRPLATALGPDQPFWCIGEVTDRDMFGGWVKDPSAPTRVAEVAARYVAEITRLVPEGPVVLLGNCLGAVYAYEVAQQMSELGRVPFLLTMIDDLHAPETVAPEQAEFLYFLRSSTNLMRQRGLAGFLINPRRVLRATNVMVARLASELKRKREMSALARAHASGRDLSQRLKVRDFIEKSYRSVQNYKYLPYAGPVVIARQSLYEKFYPALSENNAWGDRLSDAQVAWVTEKFRGNGVKSMAQARAQARVIQTRIDELLSATDQTFVEHVPESSTPESPSGQLKFSRGSDGYDLSLQLHSDAYIDTPRPAQRQWLVSERARELTQELEHLHRAAPDMGAARGTLEIGGRDTADLTPENLMEDWQFPLMREMARIAASRGGDVLEIGYGRGVAAQMINAHHPDSHTIVDCNPHVLRSAEAWRASQPGSDIQLVDGLWQDVVGDLGQFDGVLFHTYPLSTDELSEVLANYSTFAEVFFPDAARLLRPGGRFTYFVAEADSLSRAHQRALLTHFSSFTIGQVHDLQIPEHSPDAHWFDRIVTVEAVR